MRLDVYLTEKGLCKSRAEAQSLIKCGGVTLNGKPAKCSAEASDSDEIAIIGEKLRYVSRGGLKLEKALEVFGIDLRGKTCLDIGASTGGFTDCMLQHGAEKVFAVDVGKDQLDSNLRSDSRVISLEQTDIRDFSFDEYGIDGADFVGTDVSFISLKLILPHIHRLLKTGGKGVVLIKPQFEVVGMGKKKALSKNGVVRDEKTRLFVADEITKFAENTGFSIVGREISPITGGEGNVEYLLCFDKR